jgi:ferric-dicitrate binding protein FerR (iron transport regulator)
MSVTDAMTSSHDQPVRSADITSPHPEPGRRQRRRVATLLAAAAPLAAAAWAIAPASAAFATATPPAATHASAMLTGSDCLAAFGGHQAPKLPECLGD